MRKKSLIILPVLLFVTLFCALSLGFTKKGNDLEISYEIPKTESYVGERVDLPEIFTVHPDRVRDIVITVKSPAGEEIAVEENAFRASAAGEYKVYIVAIGRDGDTYTEFYSVNVSVAKFPVLTSEPNVPVMYLSGNVYAVPAAEFTDFNTATPTVTAYTAEYIDESGNASEVGDTFSPKVSVSGTKIRLKYTAKSSLDSENSVVYEIPVSIAEKSDEYGIPVYDYAEMFYCGGSGIAKMGEKGVQFAFSEPVKYDFANKVNASFKVELSSEQGVNGFDAVKVTARDAQNKNVALSFTVYKNADGANSSVVLNDGQAYAAGGSLADFKDGFKLEFDNVSGYVKDGKGNRICKVGQFYNGAVFDGFPSKMVYLSFEILQVSGNSKMNVVQINSHYFTSDGYDGIAPFVVLDGYVKTSYVLGDTIVIPKGNAVDVADPDAHAFVTVRKNNAVVTSTGGKAIDELSANAAYSIAASETGEYILQYTAVDKSGNIYDVGYYTVYVTNKTALAVSLKSSLKATYSWGETIVIPEAAVGDGAETLIYVTGPKTGYKIVQAGDSYKFESYGKYYIHYFVYDSFGNIGSIDLMVEVK